MAHSKHSRHSKTPEVLFHEVQRFTQWWIWVLIIGVVGLQVWGFVEQIILGRPWGSEPAPDWMLIMFFVLFGIGMPWLLLSCRLETVVAEGGITVRFVPFHRAARLIDFAGIKSHAARKYNPILEYGGWGVRMGTRGDALNVSGNMGVQFVFNNGRRLLVGSAMAEQFDAAVTEAMDRTKRK